jgi:hypothetical protein
MKYLTFVLILASLLGSAAHAGSGEKSTKETGGGSSVGNGNR